MKIKDKLNDKKILIWGYGREGKATESFIKKFCDVKKLDIFEGKEDELKYEGYDYVIKSPGINVSEYRENFTSATELFLEEFGAQTIGITGTKGKSTTSSMLYSALVASMGDNVLLVGNIGLPCLNYYENIDKDTIVVFEMSCHQLAHLKFSPHISVFLNLFEDHLDFYKTKENYFNAKKNITLNQSENDYFFCGENVPGIKTKAITKTISYDNKELFDMKLKGEHNQFNAKFVYEICVGLFKCDKDKTKSAIEDFEGLPHRLEYVGKVGDAQYYDDSISTIPEATIEAIKSIDNAKTVIIGGMDRHIDYSVIIEFIKAHPKCFYILSYESGKRIYDEVSELEYCFYKKDLEEAVKCAKEITPKGFSCILSPAAASYGYFKNFEERGDAFKKLVLED